MAAERGCSEGPELDDPPRAFTRQVCAACLQASSQYVSPEGHAASCLYVKLCTRLSRPGDLKPAVFKDAACTIACTDACLLLPPASLPSTLSHTGGMQKRQSARLQAAAGACSSSGKVRQGLCVAATAFDSDTGDLAETASITDPKMRKLRLKNKNAQKRFRDRQKVQAQIDCWWSDHGRLKL